MSRPKIIILLAIAIGILAWNNSGGQSENASSKRALTYPTRAFLRKCDKYILLSIDPSSESDIPKSEQFHNHRVLGQTEIKDSKRKWELTTALIEAVERDRDVKYGFSCFNPRHGIRAIAETNTIDLLICFECGTIEEFGNSGEGSSPLNPGPRDLFNRTLTEAGVTLANR
jgi:hypothetical protein